MVHYMDATGDQLAAAIGTRIRAGRLARKFTLDQMAERSGVSRRMIVKVEKGEANPSVGTLLLLGGALGIGLPSLVGERDGVSPEVTLSGDGTVLWTSPAGGSGVLLAGTPAPDVLALWQWTLAPGDVHKSDAHSPGTREILHVISGMVTITLTGEPLQLSTGDTLTFAGDQPHSYANPGSEIATFSLTVSEPDVGAPHPGNRHA